MMRTPMRLLAMPSRTPFFGSLFRAKNAFRASPRASGSRNSPPTMTPCGERIARDLMELGDTVVRDARGGELRRADLQADETLGLVAALLLAARLAARRELRKAGLRQGELALPERRALRLRKLERLGIGDLLAGERELLLPERGLRLLRRLRGLRLLRRLRLARERDVLLPERNLRGGRLELRQVGGRDRRVDDGHGLDGNGVEGNGCGRQLGLREPRLGDGDGVRLDGKPLLRSGGLGRGRREGCVLDRRRWREHRCRRRLGRGRGDGRRRRLGDRLRIGHRRDVCLGELDRLGDLEGRRLAGDRSRRFLREPLDFTLDLRLAGERDLLLQERLLPGFGGTLGRVLAASACA